MKSIVIVRMATGLKYEITMDTQDAIVFTRKMSRVWMGERGLIDELNLADGSRVLVNPAHAVAVEVW